MLTPIRSVAYNENVHRAALKGQKDLVEKKILERIGGLTEKTFKEIAIS